MKSSAVIYITHINVGKICTACKKEKPLSIDNFKPVKTKNGFSSRCKSCISEKDKEYRSRTEIKQRSKTYQQKYISLNRDIVSNRNKRWNEENWARRLLYATRHNKRERELRGRKCEAEINEEYIVQLWEKQSGLCYFTEVPMTTNMYKLETVSVDRLDNSVGYIPGNVVLSTKAANLARGIHSIEEFMNFLQKVKNHA